MYKVFLNDRLIVIAAPGNITKNKPVSFFENPAGKNNIKKWFNLFKINNVKEEQLISSAPGQLFETFRSIFTELPAAGGIVLKNGKLLFILRRGKWDLPKGKIDSGESPQKAALREVEEECGISGLRITKTLPSTFHIYLSDYKNKQGKWIFKEVHWFEMSYSGEHPGTPETEEDITQIKWLAPFELDDVWSNTYENLKEVIRIYRE